jgi:hypothetical protein
MLMKPRNPMDVAASIIWFALIAICVGVGVQFGIAWGLYVMGGVALAIGIACVIKEWVQRE